MKRFLCVALLFAAVAGVPQQNDQPSDSQLNVDEILKKLGLTDEQRKIVDQGENSYVEYLAHLLQNYIINGFPKCDSIIVDPAKIKFTLYGLPNKKISWNGTENPSLGLAFNHSLPTQILVHGKYENEKTWNGADLSFTYELRGNRMNLITLDWSQYNGCLYIVDILSTIPGIANVLSNQVTKTLSEVNQANFKNIRFTGFGLGAQVAGLAGKKIPQKIHRITGLDPAGLFYDLVSSKNRLDKSDADFVDIIYTNRQGLGMKQLVGSINFLPNGGRTQKACSSFVIGKNACSHRLSVDYYVESVNKGTYGFVCKPADSWNDFLQKKTILKESEIMGEDVSGELTGNYYLDVNDKIPYSKGISGAYLFENLKPSDAQPAKAM